MIPLYLYILLGSLSIPLLFSIFFIDFIKHWKHFFLSTFIIAIIFLLWDAFFTHYGIWGFNSNYCLDIKLLKMPIEEWLFFFVIPFCSLFTHYALRHVVTNFSLSNLTTNILTLGLIVLISIVLITNLSKAYTAINGALLLATLLIGFFYYHHLLQQFFASFLIILIPFFIVNGILTGAITESPIVWYNNSENLGIRLFTIPVEDIGYAFTMLFGNLMIFESFNRKLKKLHIVSLS